MAGLGDETIAASDRSLEVLGDTASRERAEAFGWRSRLFMLLGRYGDAIPPGTIELARGSMQGRYDEAEQHLRKAEEIAPSIRDPQAIVPMIGLRMRLLLARGHYGVGDAVEPIEHMIDDPVVYQVLPLIARVEAAAALVAHDSAAPSRISGLVDTLRKVRASLDDDGYLARNADAWLCLTEAELWRARGEASTQLWRQADGRFGSGHRAWAHQPGARGARLGLARPHEPGDRRDTLH